ncbi:kinesin-like protein, partial [Trifolium medium]|nr:kinesin-like protein [Trifolium medium]
MTDYILCFAAVCGSGWRWRRQLFAWEDELWGECCSVLANILLQVDTSDEWEWLPDPDKAYSVQGAYQVLTSSTAIERNIHGDLIWNKVVPTKVSTFVWRLLSDRLPTKYHLFVCGCLHSDSILCSAGCNVIEDVIHLFLNCPLSGAVWYDIISWVGIPCVLPDNAIALASQFGGTHDIRKSCRNCLQAI